MIRQEALNFLVESHSRQIKSGLDAAQVKLTTSLPILRDASVQPIVNLFNFLSGYSGRQVIQRVSTRIPMKWPLADIGIARLGRNVL